MTARPLPHFLVTLAEMLLQRLHGLQLLAQKSLALVPMLVLDPALTTMEMPTNVLIPTRLVLPAWKTTPPTLFPYGHKQTPCLNTVTVFQMVVDSKPITTTGIGLSLGTPMSIQFKM